MVLMDADTLSSALGCKIIVTLFSQFSDPWKLCHMKDGVNIWDQKNHYVEGKLGSY